MVKEAAVSSASYASPKTFSFDDFFADKILLSHIIRKGVPYAFFRDVKQFSPFTEEDWARLLGLSKRSLQRYKDAQKRFKPLQSEKIIEMAEVTKVGLTVFGSMKKFKDWLRVPCFALGKLKPFDLLNDSYGKELVLAEMAHIDHGIFV